MPVGTSTAPVDQNIDTDLPLTIHDIAERDGLEVVDGHLVEKPMSINSSEVEIIISYFLLTYLSGNRIARVFPQSLGYRCFPDDPDRVRKPDVTLIRTERLKELPEGDAGFMPIIPDLAVEVLSPNDRTQDISGKVREYLKAGFPLIWVVDPGMRTLTIYPADGRPSILTDTDDVTCEALLPGFRCKVGDFFPHR